MSNSCELIFKTIQQNPPDYVSSVAFADINSMSNGGEFISETMH